MRVESRGRVCLRVPLEVVCGARGQREAARLRGLLMDAPSSLAQWKSMLLERCVGGGAER